MVLVVLVVAGVLDIAVVNAVCWAGFDCRPGYALAEASSSPAVSQSAEMGDTRAGRLTWSPAITSVLVSSALMTRSREGRGLREILLVRSEN